MNHSWSADLLLTRVDTPIRFHLYGCFLDLIDVSTNDKEAWGSDSEGKHHSLRKKDILFACPVDVQRHIEMDESIMNPQLKQQSLSVDERKLESTVGENIVLSTRGNHVIRGELQAFDKYHLFMRVGNKVVLVYRHGLFNFNKETVPSLTKINDLRELRKKKLQEWVKASRLNKETVPNQTEGNDRNEVHKKRPQEQVEANRPKKETVPSQTKTNDLHELRKKREKWVEANRENSFEEGIKRLLTNLYPDNAHFIYELLQNAEDAGASEVRFVLKTDKLKFEHNGDQLFTIDDIKSITNFGSSTKVEDSTTTSIGKFGIGFKAVFAYTATPEIESGKYHFRIREMVVPDTDGLTPGTLDERKTHFVFPFDNPEKPPDRARAEIEKNLRQLNESTLLFLSNIRKIEYDLPDDSGSGYLERKEKGQDRNRIEISVKHPENLIPNSTHYLRFEKDVFVRDEKDGKLEKCGIAVAFGMEKPEGRAWKITPLNQGQVCIYFPAIKETSKLLFHMHAPFASTVARDSVRECPANTELLNHLADLIAESMSAIRDRGLLDVEFLAVLPNAIDNLSVDYLPIQKQLIKTFNNEKLTPMKQGGHAAASGLYHGTQELSELIQDGDLAMLLGKDRSLPLWVAEPQLMRKRDERGRYVQDVNALQQNKRISDFLSMLNISEWTTEEFIEVLRARGNTAIEWLQEKSDDWHQRLYVLLGDFLPTTSSYSYLARERKDKLLPLSIVRCKDGNYRTGGQCHFLNDDVEFDAGILNVTTDFEQTNKSLTEAEDDEHKEEFHYVAKGVYSSGQNKDQQDKAREFLKAIGVCEVDETEQIKLILKQRYRQGTIELRKPHHKRDLERFIALVEKERDKAALFSHYFIFELDNGRWGQPSNHAFVDSPYLDTGLTVYYEAIDKDSNRFRRALSPKYAKSGIDPKTLGKFAKAVEAQTKLEAIKQEIPDNHPERQYLVDSAAGQWRYTGNNEDYIIPEFKTLLDNPSIDKSRLIWRTMCSLDERYLESRFWNNRRYMNRSPGKSSLVHDLRNAEWVPQKDGDSISPVRPCDALREHLPVEVFLWPKGYPHDAGEKWLDAIEFGKAAREQKTEHIQWNQKAKDLGFDSGDDAEEWAGFAHNLKEKGISIDDVKSKFSSQNSGTNPDFPTAPARNQERRAKLIAEQLRNIPEKAEVPDLSVQIRRREIDRHTRLRDLYTNDFGKMTCQICEEEMSFKKRDGEYYFEAVEILTSHYFPKEHEAQLLALCPECAARYKYFVIGDTAAMEALKKQLMNSNNLKTSVQLGDLETSIRFVETHLLDLKTILHCYGIQLRYTIPKIRPIK